MEKHAVCQRDYIIQSFLSILHIHGNLCKDLGIDLSIDLAYSMFFYIVLTPTKMKIPTAHLLYEVPAICVNTGKATFTFTLV